jgi:hypothetical protein
VREQSTQQMPIGCGHVVERSPNRAMLFETPTMLGLCCSDGHSIGMEWLCHGTRGCRLGGHDVVADRSCRARRHVSSRVASLGCWTSSPSRRQPRAAYALSLRHCVSGGQESHPARSCLPSLECVLAEPEPMRHLPASLVTLAALPSTVTTIDSAIKETKGWGVVDATPVRQSRRTRTTLFFFDSLIMTRIRVLGYCRDW